MKNFKIAVFAKHYSPTIRVFVDTFMDKMAGRWEGYTASLNPENNLYDIVIVFGGDGTVLHAANFIHKHSVIFGFNMGTLGFLTPWDAEKAVSVITTYLKCESSAEIITKYSLQRSRSLRGVLVTDPNFNTYHQLPMAINEYVIRHKQPNRMLHLKCTIDDRTATEYHADALIVSTALGSTAYSLAAGGSIMAPALATWSIVPVAPHSLTHRPLIVSSNSKITLETGPDISIIIDGKEWESPYDFGASVLLDLQDAQCTVRMVQPKDFNLYTVLNEKFRWGQRG